MSKSKIEVGSEPLRSYVPGVDGIGDAGLAWKPKRSTSISDGDCSIDLGVDCPKEGTESAREIR